MAVAQRVNGSLEAQRLHLLDENVARKVKSISHNAVSRRVFSLESEALHRCILHGLKFALTQVYTDFNTESNRLVKV